MTFLRRWGILILGIIFLIAGIAGYEAFYPRPSFGWTAYAPLTHTTFVPPSPALVYCQILAVVGLVLVSGWVGHRMGRRRRSVG